MSCSYSDSGDTFTLTVTSNSRQALLDHLNGPTAIHLVRDMLDIVRDEMNAIEASESRDTDCPKVILERISKEMLEAIASYGVEL